MIQIRCRYIIFFGGEGNKLRKRIWMCRVKLGLGGQNQGQYCRSACWTLGINHINATSIVCRGSCASITLLSSSPFSIITNFTTMDNNRLESLTPLVQTRCAIDPSMSTTLFLQLAWKFDHSFYNQINVLDSTMLHNFVESFPQRRK